MGIEIAGLADITRRHAAERPDAPAIAHAGRTTTYAALDRAASRVANGLIAEGVRPRVRIAHLDKSSDLTGKILKRELRKPYWATSNAKFTDVGQLKAS